MLAIGAEAILGGPAQKILGINIAAQMIVQIAALGHLVQEQAQQRRALHRLVEQGRNGCLAGGGGLVGRRCLFGTGAAESAELNCGAQACQRDSPRSHGGPENLRITPLRHNIPLSQ